VAAVPLDLYTILAIPMPILYVEWQNRGLGWNPYIAQCRLHNTKGRQSRRCLLPKIVLMSAIPESTNASLVKAAVLAVCVVGCVCCRFGGGGIMGGWACHHQYHAAAAANALPPFG